MMIDERDEMPTAELTTRPQTEHEQVERWRAEELERAGYDAGARPRSPPASTSTSTARSSSARAGCSPELALQILL